MLDTDSDNRFILDFEISQADIDAMTSDMHLISGSYFGGEWSTSDDRGWLSIRHGDKKLSNVGYGGTVILNGTEHTSADLPVVSPGRHLVQVTGITAAERLFTRFGCRWKARPVAGEYGLFRGIFYGMAFVWGDGTVALRYDFTRFAESTPDQTIFLPTFIHEDLKNHPSHGEKECKLLTSTEEGSSWQITGDVCYKPDNKLQRLSLCPRNSDINSWQGAIYEVDVTTEYSDTASEDKLKVTCSHNYDGKTIQRELQEGRQKYYLDVHPFHGLNIEGPASDVTVTIHSVKRIHAALLESFGTTATHSWLHTPLPE